MQCTHTHAHTHAHTHTHCTYAANKLYQLRERVLCAKQVAFAAPCIHSVARFGKQLHLGTLGLGTGLVSELEQGARRLHTVIRLNEVQPRKVQAVA
jgi:hypothetical protein